MKFSPLGMAFWVIVFGAIPGLWELVNVVTGHVDLTLSYQVWYLASVQPTWVTVLFQIAAGAATTLLALHFWSHKR